MLRYKFFLFSLKLAILSVFLIKPSLCGQEVINLKGKWQLSYDADKKKEETVQLPGTMDEWKKGIPNTNKNQTMHLSRLVTFEGEARYSKEITIPASFKDKLIFLTLERTKKTTIYIDGKEVGQCQLLLSPHRYDLSAFLTPGKHVLTIVVDNQKHHFPSGVQNSHALVEHTQTNWNGILGKITLEAYSYPALITLNVFPQRDKKSSSIRLKIINNHEAKKATLTLNASPKNFTGKTDNTIQHEVDLKPGPQEITLDYPFTHPPKEWSEWDPALYTLTATLNSGGKTHSQVKNFGYRSFITEKSHFTINGKTTFLRGKHDACVFPLTAYPPMEKEGWLRYFTILRDYGINHVRFHSWTPPEAAFEAADILGLYLQPELPFWGHIDGNNPAIMDFYKREGLALLEAYTSHPSFVMLALGNESSGKKEILEGIIQQYRSSYPHVMYAYGSNNNLGRKGYQVGEDFLSTCRVGDKDNDTYKPHVRASFAFVDAKDGGILNGTYPNTRFTFSDALGEKPMPVISHETGQFQVFPNYDELKKYTGVLKPWNLEIFKNRAEKKGLGAQLKSFHKVSAAWAAQCYKADIELMIRTPELGGFQILDLQDFPGQGTALVGLLDAFMDSKGAITPEEFYGFCSETVPLAAFDKYTWIDGETLNLDLMIAHYGPQDASFSLEWKLTNNQQTVLHQGTESIQAPQGTVTDPKTISIPLKNITTPEIWTLTLSIPRKGQSPLKNSYSLWIYPHSPNLNTPKGINIVQHLTPSQLHEQEKGSTLLYFPTLKDMESITLGGLFTPDYWNYGMFKNISLGAKKPVSPGTLSLLIDPKHPLFKNFPTQEHTNWQWWPIIHASRPHILNGGPQALSPIIQVVDNIERNHKLGLLYELSVDDKKILICMADREKLLNSVEGKQFYSALLTYMASPQFAPSLKLSPEEFTNLFSEKVLSSPESTPKVDIPTDYSTSNKEDKVEIPTDYSTPNKEDKVEIPTDYAN